MTLRDFWVILHRYFMFWGFHHFNVHPWYCHYELHWVRVGEAIGVLFWLEIYDDNILHLLRCNRVPLLHHFIQLGSWANQSFKNLLRISANTVKLKIVQAVKSCHLDNKASVAYLPHCLFNCVCFCITRQKHSRRRRYWKFHPNRWKRLLHLFKCVLKLIFTHNS